MWLTLLLLFLKPWTIVEGLQPIPSRYWTSREPPWHWIHDLKATPTAQRVQARIQSCKFKFGVKWVTKEVNLCLSFQAFAYIVRYYLNVSWLWSYVALNFMYIKYTVPMDDTRKNTFITVLYTEMKLVNRSK